jgi:hypothetical protein
VVLDLLRQQFTKNQLFGEVLGADYNAIFASWAACSETRSQEKDRNQTARHVLSR